MTQDIQELDRNAKLERIGKIAYKEAVRGISQQRSSLDELRARTGAVLSAGILATAFLGSFAVKGTGIGLAARFWGPVILFGIATALCIAVLLPLPGWVLTLDTRKLLDSIDITDPPTRFKVYDDGVTELVAARKTNGEKLDWMFNVFIVAAVVIMAEIIWWLIVIV
jgi:hypothetical protein